MNINIISKVRFKNFWWKDEKQNKQKSHNSADDKQREQRKRRKVWEIREKKTVRTEYIKENISKTYTELPYL